MNTPNRYHLWAALECHAFSKAEAVLRFSAEKDGMWVQWQDYARLEAEVERLRLQVGTDAIDREHGMCCDSSAENAQLKAEVERLTKLCQATSPDGFIHIRDINAAKEGKQP